MRCYCSDAGLTTKLARRSLAMTRKYFVFVFRPPDPCQSMTLNEYLSKSQVLKSSWESAVGLLLRLMLGQYTG